MNRLATSKDHLWIVALIGVVSVFKFFEHLHQPQLLVEDGHVFFRQIIELGLTSLNHAIQGWYYLPPRLGAFALLGVPPLYVPLFVTTTAVLCTGAACYLVYRWTDQLRIGTRTALALSLLLVPHNGAIFCMWANLHWVYAAVLFLLPWGRHESVLRACVLVFWGMNGPFIVVLLPVYVLTAGIYRDRERFGFLGLATLVALFQLWVRQSAHRGGEYPRLDTLPGQAWFYLEQFFGGLFLGPRLLPMVGQSSVIVTLLGIGVVLSVLWLSWRQQKLPLWVRALPLGVLLTAGVAIIGRLEFPMTFFGGGSRYYFAPAVLLFWWLIVMGLEYRQPIPMVLLILVMLVAFDTFQKKAVPQADPPWSTQIAQIEAGERDSLIFYPPGYRMFIDASHVYWRRRLSDEAYGTLQQLKAIPRAHIAVHPNHFRREGETVTLTIATNQPVVGEQTVVLYGTGSAVYQKDYTLSTVVLKIPDGKRHASATMRIMQDTVTEQREIAVIELRQPSSGLRLGFPDHAVIRIDD